MVLSVRRRIHCGMGLFCFCFLPRMRLILKDLWDGCGDAKRRTPGERSARVMTADTTSRKERQAPPTRIWKEQYARHWHA